MNTILFTWNPSKWQWDDLPQAVYEANAEGRYFDKWSCGVTRNIRPGNRAFLMRLGIPPKGIMGSGIVVSEPFEDTHWNPERAQKGDTVYRVEILFDVLSDLPIITEATLNSGILAQHNWFPQASGTHIPAKVAEELENLWSKTTQTVFTPPTTDEIQHLRTEGTRLSRMVKTYERSPEAREECLRHYGARCHVCSLVFEEQYGPIGKGFIHVHHVVPISEIRQEYEVDPVNDLRPVCPNCHAMIHKRTPPYTISELKEMIIASNKRVKSSR